MAQSYVTFTGNGSSTGPITLGFNYILKAHVKVYEGRDILANTGTLKTETTDYTWNGAGTQISMVTAPANGVIITVERQTPNDDQIVPYSDGSNLIADSLNNSDKQTLFATQELEDKQTLSSAEARDAKTTADGVATNFFKADGTTTLAGNLTITGTVDGRDVAADGTKLDGIESNAKDDQTVGEIKTLIASSPLDSSHLDANSVGNSELAANSVSANEISDPELYTLAGMPSATASILASSTAISATTSEINSICDGKTVETTLTNNDNAYPTSGAVIDYVATQVSNVRGLELIADEDNFPSSQPPDGVVISIADAGGMVVSSSGVCTTARTVGNGSDNVTINNFPAVLHSETLAGGVGLLVDSTGSGNIYNYHKLLAKEDDVRQLSDDINDFNSRYRISGTAPTSNNDDGDLWWDTTNKKLKAYNATTSAWNETQAIGNFFISTLSPSFDGSTTDFTITNAPSNVQQIILSINGVIQKPNSGSSTPSEGFALDGSTVKLSAAPATGSEYFAIVLGQSVGIGTPSNNTVSSSILQNGSVTGEKLANNINLIANQTINLGSASALQIFHDGNDSFIRHNLAGSGNNLHIEAANSIQFGDVGTSEVLAQMIPNGACTLWHDNIQRIETTDSGVNVTDNTTSKIKLTPTGSSVGNAVLAYDGTTFDIGANSDTARIEIKVKGASETAINCIPDDAVEIYFNNSKKFYSYASGIKVVGHVRPDANDSYNVGVSSSRWDNIYATNGTINTSDRNEKNTITTSDLGLDFINKLKPVSYKFNNKTRTHYGLISQDIETLLSDIGKPTSGFAGFIKEDVSENGDGSEFNYGLRYHEFISPLVKAVQELSAKVAELEAKQS